MNKEEKITISVNEEDVQNIINAYEKDIEYINQLEKENKELKRKLNEAIHKATEFESEVYELEKQLEEYKNPLKGIFAQVNADMLLRNCGAMQSVIDTYKNQQKEFINYLEDEIKRINPKNLDVGELNLRLDDIKFTQYLIYKEILQKYKSIIGE